MKRFATALAFLAPAFVLLGALVVYPIFATLLLSFRDRTGSRFVGLANYAELATNPRVVQAIQNTAIWVLVVPAVVTALGLVFAVLTERVTFSRAFKTVVFMPMAISLLAGGVIWRIVYDSDPGKGLVNAGISAVTSVVRPPGPYPGARPSAGAQQTGGSVVTEEPVDRGDVAVIGLVAVSDRELPEEAGPARPPRATDDGISGVVYRDFTSGGGGERGAIDPGERGLPGVRVEVAGAAGEAVAATTTGPQGEFTIGDLPPGTYEIRLPEANFRGAFEGIGWLGPTFVTPAIIVSYVWIWAGFSMVVIGAGLAALPRELLEAARVDGASEWQTFRRVTVPLLGPVLGVVFVTLVINVLKIFDIVLVIAPQDVQDEANVIALEMWRTAFAARDIGLGSAIAVLLFVLVIPIMALNVRRFRLERT